VFPDITKAFLYKPAVAWPDSQEVQEWMKELDSFNIPGWSPTKDGACAEDPIAVSEAKDRGWWTCGAWTRDTDITACPEKYTWGVSFDDGPSPYSTFLCNSSRDILTLKLFMKPSTFSHARMCKNRFLNV
jgi:hypothetical protein